MLNRREIRLDWAEADELYALRQRAGELIIRYMSDKAVHESPLQIPYCPARLPQVGDRVVFRWERAGICMTEATCIKLCEGNLGTVSKVFTTTEDVNRIGRSVLEVVPDEPKNCALGGDLVKTCPPFPEELDLLLDPRHYTASRLIDILISAGAIKFPAKWLNYGRVTFLTTLLIERGLASHGSD